MTKCCLPLFLRRQVWPSVLIDACLCSLLCLFLGILLLLAISGSCKGHNYTAVDDVQVCVPINPENAEHFDPVDGVPTVSQLLRDLDESNLDAAAAEMQASHAVAISLLTCFRCSTCMILF